VGKPFELDELVAVINRRLGRMPATDAPAATKPQVTPVLVTPLSAVAPVPVVGTDANRHVLYELLLTNTGSAAASLRSVEVRSIDRSELYVADEIFLCGTGVQISPVTEIDHRPVGSGEVGPIASLIRERYFDAVRGRNPAYSSWLTPVY